jgi:hypothetical protein
MSYSLRASQRLKLLLPSLQKKPTFNLRLGMLDQSSSLIYGERQGAGKRREKKAKTRGKGERRIINLTRHLLTVEVPTRLFATMASTTDTKNYKFNHSM